MKFSLDEYFDSYKRLAFDAQVYPKLQAFKAIAQDVKANGKKMIFAGNGASAAISAHGAVDFTKQAKVRSITFNEADLITCYSNDFGYENWIAECLKSYADDGDVVVLISVSGESPNILKAASVAKELGLAVITFSGRSSQNSLASCGAVNFWVDSHAYNVVECIHMIWLTTVIDAIVGRAVYEVSS